jgi:hypothetical protein
MATGTFISFGHNPQAPGGAMMPGPTSAQDGIVVTESLSDVAHELATKGEGAWPRLTRRWTENDIEVYVNPASVRFITEIELR